MAFKNKYNRNKKTNSTDVSDMDILSKGAYFIIDKNANKKIDSEISLSDNIKQKIKALNHDYESRNDQEITGNVEKAICSIALVLHGVFAALPAKNGGFNGPTVSKAYNGVKSDITNPRQAFIFLSIIARQYKNEDLFNLIFELKKYTKKAGDMGRHTNFDSNNDLRKIADTYNEVVDGIASCTKLSAIKRYKIIPNKTNKSLECPYCHKVLGSSQGLVDHIKTMHSDGKSSNAKRIDPVIAEKRSKTKTRFIVSGVLSVLLFAAILISLSVGFNVSFVTSLWISAIVLFVSFAFAYEMFPKKFLYSYFSGFNKRLRDMSNSVSTFFYDDDKLLKFLSYTGIYVFLYPLTFIFALISGILISSITIIPVILLDIF